MRASKRLQGLSPSYIREILTTAQQPGMISFAGGLPDPSLFPMELLQQALSSLANDTSAFQYGQTQGDSELRQLILKEHYSESNLDCLITTGAQQALDLIARAYLNPGDTVLLEAPCYLGALQVFELAEANIITVNQTPDGPDMERLETLLDQYKPKLFYTVPDFHNPTGICWSLAAREKIAQLLNDRDVLLVEDAPYRQLSFNHASLPMVSDLTNTPSIRLGSFSKISSPGLRVGYAVGKTESLEPLILIKQAADLHSTNPAQRVLVSLLMSGLMETHIAKICEVYKQKAAFMIEQLRNQLGSEVVISQPAGGMFVWLDLKNHDARKVTEIALKKGVAVVPGDVFYPSNAQNTAEPQSLRLNFTNATYDDIEEGIRRLKKAVDCSERLTK